MSILEIFIIAVSLSMDAFAVSICKGLSLRKTNFKHMLIIGFYFGFFQGFMPFIGYYLGINFKNLIMSIDHWIAFILLFFIGFNMIKESRSASCSINSSVDFKTMLPLAIATSIDALTIGITFSMFAIDILESVLLISITTFVFSSFGVKAGSFLGERAGSTAEFVGGLALILLGAKILLEHLGILVF